MERIFPYFNFIYNKYSVFYTYVIRLNVTNCEHLDSHIKMHMYKHTQTHYIQEHRFIGTSKITHTYTHINMCTHQHTHTHTHTHTHARAHTHTHARIHAHIYTHMHTCIGRSIHTHTYTYAYTYAYRRICSHIHVHTHTHTHTHNTHTHTHTHTYGGGVMLLINYCFHIIDSKQYSFGHTQELCADVLCYNASGVIRFRPYCVYRPPNSDMSSSLLFLRALQSEIAPVNVNNLTLIMGDLNLTKIDWLNSHSFNCRCKIAFIFSALWFFYKLCTNLLMSAILQILHVFVSHDNFICDLNVIPFSTSDHCGVVVSLLRSAFINVNESTDIPNNKPRLILPSVNRPKLDFEKIDIVGLASELRHIDWSTIFPINDHVEYAWNKFSSNIATLIEKYTPVKPPIRRRLPCNLPCCILNLFRKINLHGPSIKYFGLEWICVFLKHWVN